MKCGRNSVEICNVTHSGIIKKYTYPMSEISNVQKLMEDLAKAVFLYAQLNFPTRCKCEGISLLGRGWARNNYEDRQKRNLNWAFRSGEIIKHPSQNEGGKWSSQLPDFIGCDQFGKHGLRDLL